MERVVFDRKVMRTKKVETQQTEGDRFNNFEKFQETLYKKFNNASLNRMVLPLKLSQRSFYPNGESPGETMMDGVLSRTLLSSTSAQLDLRTLTTLDGALSNKKSSTSKRRRTEVKKFDVNGQTWTQIPSDKWKLVDKREYGDDVDVEAKKAELQLDDETERFYIEKLNRNIKTKRPGTSTSVSTLPLSTTSKNSEGLVSIDSFFSKKVEDRIELDDTLKEKPTNFKK